MSDEELVETTAKALYKACWDDLLTFDEDKQQFVEYARAALAVFREHTASLGLTEPSLVASDRVTTSEHTAPTYDEPMDLKIADLIWDTLRDIGAEPRFEHDEHGELDADGVFIEVAGRLLSAGFRRGAPAEHAEPATPTALALLDRLERAEKVIAEVREFATKERDSIRGRYGAGASAYVGYANACDDILGILAGYEKEETNMIERTETPEDEVNNALEEPKSVRTSTIAESEYWTAELGQDVEIIARGWVHSPTDHALYIDGTFVVAFKNLDEIEEYLSRYFVLQPREETT